MHESASAPTVEPDLGHIPAQHAPADDYRRVTPHEAVDEDLSRFLVRRAPVVARPPMTPPMTVDEDLSRFRKTPAHGRAVVDGAAVASPRLAMVAAGLVVLGGVGAGACVFLAFVAGALTASLGLAMLFLVVGLLCGAAAFTGAGFGVHVARHGAPVVGVASAIVGVLLPLVLGAIGGVAGSHFLVARLPFLALRLFLSA